MTPAVYTIAETAALLGVHRNTVAAMLARRELTRVQVGRNIRIPRAEVDALAKGEPIPRKRR